MSRALAVLLTLCLLLGSWPAKAEEKCFSNLEDLLNYLYYDCAYMLADEISFSYTSELDDVFSTSDPLHDMLANCGMLDWVQYRDTERRTVKIENIDYQQGYKMAQAWERDMLYLLDAEEQAALSVAQSVVEDMMWDSNNKWEVVQKVHDYLVRTVTFEASNSGEWDYRDTAIGALNYGRAECDGYADAFYLMCTLASIPAGFQVGYAGDQEGQGAHMWNLVFLDGWYYHVDVTWDDKDREEAPGMATYRYFCVGSSMLDDHYWDSELSPYNQAAYNNWDYFFYTYDKDGSNGGAYFYEL